MLRIIMIIFYGIWKLMEFLLKRRGIYLYVRMEMFECFLFYELVSLIYKLVSELVSEFGVFFVFVLGLGLF